MTTKTGALVAAILGSAVVSVDATVVNVALPSITDDLGGGLAGQQWVANSYLLTLAALILISGSLADLFGERRIFVLGVVGFGVTSVLCAVAPSIEVLIAARALQGVSGALLTPASLAILIAVFPPAERGKAIGTWTAWGGIGILIGPLLGGQIVDSLSWRWVFGVNVPLVALTLALAARYVPEGHRAAGPRPHVDVRGAVLCALGLAGPTFALIEQPMLGWGDPRVWGFGLVGLALFGLFVRHESRGPEPMLPLNLFTRRNFRWGNVETLAMYGGLSIMTFFLTLFLQQVAGFTALQAGTIMLVPTGVMFVLARRFGALADRFGPRLFMGIGPVVSAVGLLLLMRVDATVSFVGDLLPALLVFSLGLAMSVAPLTAAVLADADEEHAGIASAVNNAVARTAALLGTAAVGAILASSFAGRIDDAASGFALPPAAQGVVQETKDRTLGVASGAGIPAELTAATSDAAVETFHLSLMIGAALMAAGGVIGLVGIRNPPREVCAEDCAGGQFAGQPVEAGRAPAPVPAAPLVEPAPA